MSCILWLGRLDVRKPYGHMTWNENTPHNMNENAIHVRVYALKSSFD
jgi:hypothetical protein